MTAFGQQRDGPHVLEIPGPQNEGIIEVPLGADWPGGQRGSQFR
jgi:hypothetical protein